MALVLADRVRETTTVTGTGTATLLGAAPGYQSFSVVGNANTTYYVIANQSATEWEVGIGTYTSSGTTLSRDTVLASSNGGSLVNFSAGTKDVFVDYPAGRAVYEDAAGNVDGYPITGGTINNTTVGATTPSTGVFTTLTGNSTSQFGRSSANYLQAVGAASSSSPIFSVAGSDTNIDLNLTAKGTGGVVLNTNSIDAVVVKSSVPTIFGSTTTTNLLNKYFVIGSRQYTTTEVGTTLIGSENTSTANSVMIGGYYGELNAASTIQFYTAGTVTTRSGTKQFQVSNTASAVNYVQVTGAATGGQVFVNAAGSDSNIGIGFTAKLFANTTFFAAGGFSQFQIGATASSVNFLQAKGGATGFGAVLSAQGSDTNIPLVLQPKGTGALQAQQTDSTATGGNARGANAVDWQTSRSTAAQVGSGSGSVVGGGAQNIASSAYATVTGGLANSVTAFASFIGAGQSNTSSGGRSAVVTGRGNTAAGELNFIGGGFTNSGTSASAVTTQSGTMNGTTAVTLSGSNANIKVGQFVTGTSIASETYVAAVSGTSLTLSQAASGSSTSTLSFYTPHGVVVGGGNNQATGSYSFIGGGGDAGDANKRNAALADWSTVVGGRANLISANTGNNTGFHFIGGGDANSITTANAHAAICGGSQNSISSSRGFVGGGSNNTIQAIQGSILGGTSNTASGTNSSILGGQLGTTRSISGQHTFAACSQPVSSTQGSSQAGLLIIGRQTTDATATVLCSDANAASTVNQVILPNNSAYYFKGSVIANVTGGGNTKAWAIEGAIKRGANAASTALVGTPTVTSSYADVGAATWAITATADTTNGGLAITFTGQASTTIRVVAKLETTEVTF